MIWRNLQRNHAKNKEQFFSLAVGKQLLDKLGVKYDDKEKRYEAFLATQKRRRILKKKMEE